MPERIPFFTQAAILDQFIRADPPDDQEVRGAVMDALRSQPDLLRYFFSQRPSASWVPLLWEHGFLSEPPMPVETDSGSMLSFWFAQEYLLSVASDVPAYVLMHLAALHTHPNYAGRVIRTLSTLKPDILLEAVPALRNLLSNPIVGQHITHEVCDLLPTLCEAHPDAGLQVLEALTRPLANPQAAAENRYARRAEALALIDVHGHTPQEVKSGISALARSRTLPLLKLLEGNLLLALQIEAEANGHAMPSSWWRSAIEVSGQNYHQHYKDDLLDWLRDSAEHLAAESPDEARAFVERCAASSDDLSGVLRRLGLHLLRLYASNYGNLVSQELLERSNYDDTAIHHEFFLLLRDCYLTLSSDDKAKVWSIILDGPSAESVERLKRWIADHGAHDAEASLNGSIRYWTLQRMWMIKDNLDTEQTRELQSLVTESGEPEHPEYTHWSTGVHAVTEASPIGADDLAALSVPDLLNYLRSWTPSDENRASFNRVSWEGLGNALAPILARESERYKAAMTEILSVRPEYAYAFYDYVRRSGNGSDLPRVSDSLIVDISTGLLGIPTVIQSSAPDTMVCWRDVRQQIAWTLSTMSDSADVSASLLPGIRDCLLILSNDIDPTPEDDQPKEGWHGHDDPMSVALNRVRPSAVAGLVGCALAMASQDGSDDSYRGPGPERIEPEVRRTLTALILDQSTAVRSVFGRYLMTLYWLAPTWLELQLPNIFPEGDSVEERRLYIAAWDAYVVYNRQLDPELFEQLRPHYARAISNAAEGYITKSHLRPVEGLAVHLVFDYFKMTRAGIPATQTLLHSFFASVSGESAATAAWVVWRACKDRSEQGDPAGDWWPVVVQLWQLMLNRAASENYPTDYSRTMEWFAELLDLAPDSESLKSLWPLLVGMLPYLPAEGYSRRIWDALERFVALHVQRDPARAIELYTKMHELGKAPHWSSDTELPRKIMSTAIRDKNAYTRTLVLIDLLGRHGDWRFRDLYDEYAA